MRTLLPYFAVLLALIASGSIAYIAWDLTSGKPPRDPGDDADASQDGAEAPDQRDS